MSPTAWLTVALGVFTVLLGLARILDVRFMKSKRWPGPFASGTPRQRAQVLASMALGGGIALLGAGQALGPAHRTPALIVYTLAIVVFGVAIFAFLRASRAPGSSNR
ncbi:MAG: hypothetical protein E6J20_05175 [Chloroflexi bacterium]|nr:MAG: hypothetical protein E6J20_05175 [Chloroflexota bacterium]